MCGRTDVPKAKLERHDCAHGIACGKPCRPCASRLAKRAKNARTRAFWKALAGELEIEDE